MTCNEVVNKYLLLDKHERVPVSITVHLLYCKKCRTLIRNMTIAAESGQAEMYEAMSGNNPLFLKTLQQIGLEQFVEKPAEVKNVSLLPWIAGEILIIAGFILMPLTNVGQWTAKSFGKIFTVPFIFIAVIFFAAYIFIFIDKNLDFFVKKFGLPNSKQ